MDAAMERKESAEVTAPSVDEAVIIALMRLGLQREEAVIEVLDEGRKGILGLGSRPARVRVSRRPPLPSVVEAEPEPVPAAPAETEPKVEAETKPEPKTEPEPEPAPSVPAVEEVKAAPAPPPPQPAAEPGASQPPSQTEGLDRGAVEATVRRVVGRLVAALEVRPQLEWREEERLTLWVTLRGKDDEALVGPRGKTLDALQYLTRLLVRQEVGGDFNLIVDAGGYRKRRMRSLANLARQMADKAVRTGRSVRLRPMPASERRIIHLTLQKDRRVRTHSVGTGDHRAVTISPTRPSKRKR